MQRIADDFASIRQEMERIEAERGGDKGDHATGGMMEVKVVGGGSVWFSGPGNVQPLKSWDIGAAKLSDGRARTYVDWTDYAEVSGPVTTQINDAELYEEVKGGVVIPEHIAASLKQWLFTFYPGTDEELDE